MLAYEATEDENSDSDEIRRGVVGLRELGDLRTEEGERVARECTYEEAVLRAEQAVHGASTGTGGFCDRADRECSRPAVGHDPFRRLEQCGAGCLVVLSGSTHG